MMTKTLTKTLHKQPRYSDHKKHPVTVKHVTPKPHHPLTHEQRLHLLYVGS